MAKKDPYSYLKAKYRISSDRKLDSIRKDYLTPAAFEKAVAEHPYNMMLNYLDKNFKTADNLIVALFPHLRVSLERCRWVCWYILRRNEDDGNTRMSATLLAQRVWKDFPEVKEFILEAVTKFDLFHYDKTTNTVALSNTYNYEKRIAEEIKRRLVDSKPLDIDWNKYTEVDGFALTDEQKKILELACTKNVMMLNGSAGTGKTSCMKAMVRMLESNGYDCTILAPTGIAAKRIAEVTWHEASTIHRFLASKGEFGDFLIIDEMSMVGVNLLGSLFYDLPKWTKIIFICDEAQLASISCGNIVQNIIDSHVMPTVNLTKVFRYGIGGIATVATDVRMGKALDVDTEFDDYRFKQITDNPIKDVLEVYDGLRSKYAEDEIMILSPFNVRESGTYAINSAIQNIYNDDSNVFTYTRQNSEINFRLGDRIVNTENNYHMLSDNGEEIPVMNGEIGTIRSYDGEFMAVDFETGRAYLEKGDIYKQLLAYCISIHKSQGSQAKAVIVVADKSHGFFLKRNHLYVALSRAQKELVFVGDMPTINSCLKEVDNKDRNTWLKEMLVC